MFACFDVYVYCYVVYLFICYVYYYFIFIIISPNSACARGSGGVVCFDCPLPPPAVATLVSLVSRGHVAGFLNEIKQQFSFGKLVCGCELLSPIWAPRGFFQKKIPENLSAAANSHMEFTKNSHIEHAHIIHTQNSLT